MIDITQMWNLKIKPNEKKNKAKLINTENRLKVDKEKMGRRMGKMGKEDQQVQTYKHDVNKS